MKKPDRGECVFGDDGEIKCVETLESTVSCFAERLRVLKNPYTGNKRKILIDIFKSIENKGWKYQTFLDLFSGSGMVGATARYLGKNVIANDLMKYAYFNARYLLHSDKKLGEDSIKGIYQFVKNDKLDSLDFVRKNYANRFTPEEALYLDRLYMAINLIFPCCIRSGLRDDYVLAMLSILHYVMDHCFVGGRLNNGQVLADLEHRLKHQRNAGKPMAFTDIEWLEPFNGVGGKNVSGSNDANFGATFNEDAVSLFGILGNRKIDVDLCYIDPPYGGQQSNYSSMYEFFDAYIMQSKEESDTEFSGRFVSTKTYGQQFDDLLDAAKKIPYLVISYNDSSWCNIEDIVSAVKRFRGNVSVDKVDYLYNYRNKEESSEFPAKEFIILAE